MPDVPPAAAQSVGDFYYLQEDKPRRKKRPPSQKPADPAATVPGAPGAPADPTAAAKTPEPATAPGTATAPAAPSVADTASDTVDPRVAELFEALTGPDAAKFTALIDPQAPAAANASGEPIKPKSTETGAIPAPPPLGPDVETQSAAPESVVSPAVQPKAEAGVTFGAPIRGELDERLALEDRVSELFDAGRFTEAEAEAKRLEALLAKDTAPQSRPSVSIIETLGAIYQAHGRPDEAERSYTRALKLRLARVASLDPGQPVSLDQGEALSLARLASLASARGDAADAERLFERALAISTRYEHPATVSLLTEYARHAASSGQLQKAEDLYRRSIALASRLSDWIPPGSTVYALNSLARVKHAQGDLDGALAAFREAKNVPQASALSGPGAREAYAYDDFIAVAYERATRVPAERDTLSAEAFESAQRTKFGEAAAALAQMAARQAQKSGPLADIARQYQDQLQKRRGDERRLATLLRAEAPDRDAVAGLRGSLSDANLAVGELERLFATDFPSYAALANPAPATLAETRALLAPNEAMVVFALAGETSFAWTITRTTTQWRALPYSAREVSETVEALRCGLDYAAWRGEGEKHCRSLLQTAVTYADLTAAEPARRKPLPFDMARAGKLYEALLGPLTAEIAGKHLLFVPDGALARLPLSVLIDGNASPTDGYRGARWLGARQPITLLPSVSSLRALRRTMPPASAAEAYLGIGEPALTGTPRCPKVSVPASCPAPAAVPQTASEPPSAFGRLAAGAATSIAAFFRAGRADVDAVRALCPLPDTAYELLCVAQSLNAPPGHVIVSTSATEAAVKRLPLERYRILHFATHGLLAGETARLAGTGAEPALVLTPPAAASADDDGLLTASEISELKLNADWVVMSACNTAASGSESEEALSGLARAFFYAGARTLLVSHWEVNSQAAVKLTTAAFADLQQNPAHGRAEAMRRSMAALIEKGADYETHPAYWAPFVLVGEGNAR